MLYTKILVLLLITKQLQCSTGWEYVKNSTVKCWLPAQPRVCEHQVSTDCMYHYVGFSQIGSKICSFPAFGENCLANE